MNFEFKPKVFKDFPINSVVLFHTKGSDVNLLCEIIGYGKHHGLPEDVVPAIVKGYSYNKLQDLCVEVENILTGSGETVHPAKLHRADDFVN